MPVYRYMSLHVFMPWHHHRWRFFSPLCKPFSKRYLVVKFSKKHKRNTNLYKSHLDSRWRCLWSSSKSASWKCPAWKHVKSPRRRKRRCRSQWLEHRRIFVLKSGFLQKYSKWFFCTFKWLFGVSHFYKSIAQSTFHAQSTRSTRSRGVVWCFAEVAKVEVREVLKQVPRVEVRHVQKVALYKHYKRLKCPVLGEVCRKEGAKAGHSICALALTWHLAT